MQRKQKCLLKTFILFGVMCILFFAQTHMGTVHAEDVSLNKSKLTITKGNSYTLKLINTKKRAKWSSNNKKVATVTSKGKVTAKKKGTAVITARIGGKRYKCTVFVKKTVSVTSQQEKDVVTLVNKERIKRGIPKLRMDIKLQEAADKRAKELAENFDHVRPNGQMCYTVLDEYEMQYEYAGENIAAGQTSARSVMKALMYSNGHKSNILNFNYSKIGVGYYKSPKTPYKYYWVQIFTD